MDDLAIRVYTQLELVSTTKAATLERTHAGKHETSEPQISGAPHLAFKRRYEAARNDTGRREAIKGALEELRRLRYSKRPKVDCETRDGRLEVGRDPRPIGIVAYSYGYSERHIYRLRGEARDYDRRAS